MRNSTGAGAPVNAWDSAAAGKCFSVWLHDSHYYRLHPLRFPLAAGVQAAADTLFGGIPGHMATPQSEREKQLIEEVYRASADTYGLLGNPLAVGGCPRCSQSLLKARRIQENMIPDHPGAVSILLRLIISTLFFFFLICAF
jgi:hypothetical protein